MGRAVTDRELTLWGILAGVATAHVLFLAYSCSGPSLPPPVAPVRIERVNRACLDTPPPPEPAIQVTGPDGSCPPPYSLCFAHQHAIDLALYLGSMRDYADRAWTLCGTALPEAAGPATTEAP